ncbi:MAG: site-2 protease family protein, partial [Bacteroidales bacterium]|nr:site-2 protease family protein [Bacteroidales bacterium]
FFEAIPAGLSHGWKVFTGYISDLKYLFTKDGAESVGSFGAIGNLFPASWDWQRFWELTAFISLMLAFMNILPIPALDGGHVFFLLYEVVTGRKPGDKFMARAETVGMCLLLALMAFAIFNDFRNFVF